jgi:hypothetical protein
LVFFLFMGLLKCLESAFTKGLLAEEIQRCDY